MCIPYPEAFNTKITDFFTTIYKGQFYRFEPTDHTQKIVFYKKFDSMGISIIVTLPLYVNAYEKFDLDSCRKIKIALKLIGKNGPPYLIELTDVMMYGDWKMRLQERVSILIELMQTQVRNCPKCHVYALPKTCRTRQDKKRTQFVTLQCPKCHDYMATEYGMGLKTILHKNLKKKRSL